LKAQKVLLEKALLSSSVEIKFDLDANMPHIRVNKSELENSMTNMCINAMHAMPNGGKINIRTKQTTLSKAQLEQYRLNYQNAVLLEIEDNGSGIDPEIITKIFDPYFSTKKQYGTGLGLSQVYRFVKNSNGHIGLESELEVGTKFSLIFETTDTGSKITAPQTTHHALTAHSQTTVVLVVDDEPQLLDVIQAQLKSRNYEVLQAENGKQALTILSKHKVDIVLSDILMPEMNGVELANIILSKYSTVKVQLMSGFGNLEQMNLEDSELFEKRLVKPFSIDSLEQRLEQLYQKDQTIKENKATSD
jgi:CheY-like chemotaxis protein